MHPGQQILAAGVVHDAFRAVAGDVEVDLARGLLAFGERGRVDSLGHAIVVTSPERAKDLKQRPAVIEAAAQGSSPDQCTMVSYYRNELDGLPEMGLVGRQRRQQSGLKPTDIQTAILYDHFTPFTLIQLEELGFCGWGEAKDFIADGAIELGGRLPIKTTAASSARPTSTA